MQIVINHFAISCRDLARQEAFYTRHFGFIRSRTFNRGQPDEYFMLRLGPVRFEMFQADLGSDHDAHGGEQCVGFRHMAFSVPKLEPVLEGLMADGIKPDPIIEGRVSLKQQAQRLLHQVARIGPAPVLYRIVFFRDHEGNIIELMENYCDEDEE